jgi:hypothetical protein
MYFACRPLRQLERRHGRLENIFWHSPEGLPDSDSERDLIQDVFDLNARCDFD